jgi:hypothetical protein
MADVQAVEILIAYTALITTIMAGILGFFLKDYFPLKSKVNQLYHEVYDNGSEGLITHIEESHQEMHDEIEDVGSDVKDVKEYTRQLSRSVEEQTDAKDLPRINNND